MFGSGCLRCRRGGLPVSGGADSAWYAGGISDKDINHKCGWSVSDWNYFGCGREVFGFAIAGACIKDRCLWRIYYIFYLCLGDRPTVTERKLYACHCIYFIQCAFKYRSSVLGSDYDTVAGRNGWSCLLRKILLHETKLPFIIFQVRNVLL